MICLNCLFRVSLRICVKFRKVEQQIKNLKLKHTVLLHFQNLRSSTNLGIVSGDVTKSKKSKKRMKSDDYDSEAADELSLSLHDSDSEEECSSPKAKISKIVLSEAEKRCKKNIQEREQLWEQQKDKYENMFSFK